MDWFITRYGNWSTCASHELWLLRQSPQWST
jgi:hypothetical protein